MAIDCRHAARTEWKALTGQCDRLFDIVDFLMGNGTKLYDTHLSVFMVWNIRLCVVARDLVCSGSMQAIWRINQRQTTKQLSTKHGTNTASHMAFLSLEVSTAVVQKE